MSAIAVNPRDEMPLLLHTLCDRGCKLQPSNLIITKTASGYSTLTFAEHHARSVRLASAFSKWGVQIGDRIATLQWNSAIHLQCFHALSCMGAVVHTLNLRLGPDDQGYIIQHAKDRIIIVDFDLLEGLGKVDKAILDRVELFVCVGADGVPGKWTLPAGLPAEKCVDYNDFLNTGETTFQWPVVPETTLHALCYTSGTTGNPKGAAYSQRSTYLQTLMITGVDALGISGTGVIMPLVPMFHVVAWGLPFAMLMLGTRMVLMSRYTEPDVVLDAMVDWRVTASFAVPTVWQNMRVMIEQRGIEELKPKMSLKLLATGGSAPPLDMMRWYWEHLRVEFLCGWGMTEMNPQGTLARLSAKYSDVGKPPEEQFTNIQKCGLPVPGVQLRIVNPDNLDEEMPHGDSGELLARGPWVIQQYFDQITPDKFHKGWLITGDIAKIDQEGAMVITDRSKDVVKSGGEWISSIDLENDITAVPDVLMACVVGMPHPKWDERPVAIVTLAPGGSQEGLAERINAHCIKKFAKFQLPDDVLVWKEIPLTGTGKMDKKVVRQILAGQGYVVPSARTAAL